MIRRYGVLWIFFVFVLFRSAASASPGIAHSESGQAVETRKAAILVNQVGYLPLWPKTALLINAPENALNEKVQVIDADTHKSLYRITPERPVRDENHRNQIQVLEFDNFRFSGKYYLRQGKIKSFPFEINNDIYTRPMKKMLRSYYLQRCGVPLNDLITGLSHEACHEQDGVPARGDEFSKAGKRIRAAGGWHDAGDYGKYIATTTVTLGRLLHVYEQFPEFFTGLDLEIQTKQLRQGPDAIDSAAKKTAMPDFLEEMRVGLLWVKSMQRQDGAVYRKLSGARWPSIVPPDQDRQLRYLYGISTPETAKTAGAMAMAARIFADYDKNFAKTCLDSARLAWAYLGAHKKMEVDYHESDDKGSGKYLYSSNDTEASLKTDMDDRFWAAAELFITTGEKKYKSYILRHIKKTDFTLFEWKDPSSLGMIDLYLLTHNQGRLSLEIWKKIMQWAKDRMAHINARTYFTANSRFIWGSNKMAAEAGIHLYYAHRLSGDETFFEGALAQVNYLFGLNPFNKSFVTGIGANPVKHVHHIFARSLKTDIPGLLVGGPNTHAQDGIAPMGKAIFSYIDDARSYATNEYAIDYNAALIGLVILLVNGVSNG